ncbi:MAG: gamma-glutamylcyclotransferase [Alphaproteobacteria bacterium]|nr:gamma-glutamylcyclotransferase [Alphaproteobacteria bacterium]
MARLFIYGTLMRGFRNEARMDGANFIAVARTMEARWSMVAAIEAGHYPFPGVVAGHSFIAGELYEVDGPLLQTLDIFELEGREYVREMLALEDGKQAAFYRLILPSPLPLVDTHAQIHYDEAANCYRWIQET